MPTSTVLKATVTRRPTTEPVDQPEHQRQAEPHQAAENARQTAVEAATAIESEKSGKALKREAHALQSAFLAGNLGKPVTVFTINGLRLTGRLRQFDQFTLLLEGQDGIRSMIFKHAITTIAPTSAAPGKQHQPDKN